MTDIQILMWAMGAGFTGTWVIMGIGFKLILGEIKDLRIEIKDLRKDVQDMDRRLCRLEGSFSSKDFCMLKHDHKEKAE